MNNSVTERSIDFTVSKIYRDFEMAAENDGSPSEASTSIVMPAYPFRQLG